MIIANAYQDIARIVTQLESILEVEKEMTHSDRQYLRMAVLYLKYVDGDTPPEDEVEGHPA